MGQLNQGSNGEGGETGENTLPTSLVFESGFETGSLSDFGISDSSVTAPAGVLSVEQTAPHNGTFSALVSTTETGEHLVLSIEGDWTEMLIGFWIQMEAVYETSNWPIVHIDARAPDAINQLWDVGLDSSLGDGYRVFLWEMPAVSGETDGALAALSETSFKAGEWVHLQLHLNAASDETGFIRVLLNEEQVIDLSDRKAGNGDSIYLSFGSFAFGLEPRPANYFLDDVSVHIP